MAKDETLFTRRTEQEIDEALAWLENISSEGDEQPKQAPEGKSKPSAYDVLPTWLKMDLHLESPENPPVDAPKAKDDNLSWLDSIATGLGGPLEEPPTMSWEETAIYQVSQEDRDRALADAANVVEDNFEDESIDAGVTGAAMAASQGVIDETDIWLPTDESLESAIRNLDADDSELRKEIAREFDGLDRVGTTDEVEAETFLDESPSFLQEGSDLLDGGGYSPDADTMRGLVEDAAQGDEDVTGIMSQSDIDNDESSDFPPLMPPDLEHYVDETSGLVGDEITSLIEPETVADDQSLDFDLPFDESVQEETQMLLAEDESEATEDELLETSEIDAHVEEADESVEELISSDAELMEAFPILAESDEVAVVDPQEDVTQIYIPDDEDEQSGYVEQVSAEIEAERADFERYVADVGAHAEVTESVDSTEAITQIFLPRTEHDEDSAEIVQVESNARDLTDIYLPQSEAVQNIEELTEIYLPDLHDQTETDPRSSEAVTEIHLPTHEEQESAYLKAVDADATEIYIQSDADVANMPSADDTQQIYDDVIPEPVNFADAELSAQESSVAPESGSEPTVISQLPISARWNSLLESADSSDDKDELEQSVPPSTDLEDTATIANQAEPSNIASEIPEDPDEAMAWLEAMVRKQQTDEPETQAASIENAAEPDVVETALPSDTENWEDVDPTAETQVAPRC